MKLLGWMHRKLRDNTIEPFKDWSIGNYCTCLSAQQLKEEQDSPFKPDLSSRFGSRHAKQECYEIPVEVQETPTDIPDLFHGFLAIGTLGSSEAPMITDPPTPTFAVSLDDITEKIMNKVTPNDLKFINEELEKFIEAESEEEAYNGTSRNSYVSVITLHEAPVCPLQGYLFGSAVELPETRAVDKKNRKVSLRQLFEETKLEDRIPMEKHEYRDVPRKAVAKSSKGLVKVLKKLGSSTSKSSDDGSFGPDGDNPVAAKKKFQKVLQMFHRKLHHENPNAVNERKAKISQSRKKKNALYSNENSQGQDYVRNFTHKERRKTRLPHSHLISNCLDESEGHWIKTDADYVVLEL